MNWGDFALGAISVLAAPWLLLGLGYWIGRLVLFAQARRRTVSWWEQCPGGEWQHHVASYEAMNVNAFLVARSRERGVAVTHRDGSPLVGLDQMGDLWPSDVR